MDAHMRRILNFPCGGEMLAATLDEAAGTTGLLIVSGGNEIRIGAHRGMAKLARDVAAEGFPVFRFDRRGIGDSSGENGGYKSSGPDIDAALSAFRAECPHLTNIVCFGNCDAATALVLNETGEKALVLANPWVFEPVDDLPPPAAIKAHYWARLRDPMTWLRLLKGGINFQKALAGISRISQPAAASTLVEQFLVGLSHVVKGKRPTTILLASKDATAIAFRSEWEKLDKGARFSGKVQLVEIDSSSHSFASDADYAILKTEIITALKA
jgi:exosortase A-associated hydrolase 1